MAIHVLPLRAISRIDRQALIHTGEAEAAAWLAHFAGINMTWLEVQA